MFSLFGVSGALYRGPLENLPRVQRVAHVAAVAPVRDPDATDPPPASAPAGAHAHPPKALHAYSQAASPAVPARQALTTVADVMSQPAVWLPDHLSVAQAWARLRAHNVGQAPVLNAAGQLVGLVVGADLLTPDLLAPDLNRPAWATAPEPASPSAWSQQPVTRRMVSPVPAVLPTAPLRRVAQVLLNSHLHGLPVLGAADALLGFVSRSDLLQALVHDPPIDTWS